MTFTDQTFSGDKLKGQDFEDSQFIHCVFSSPHLRFTSFKKCVFSGCDLSLSVFDITSFFHCSFPESKLSNLDFTDVQISGCDFSKAIIKNSVFQQIRPGANKGNKPFVLTDCIFEHTDLSNTIFLMCNLKGVNFKNANLDSVTFDRCTLTEADLTGASINGTNFSTSKIERTILDVEGFISFGRSKGFIL